MDITIRVNTWQVTVRPVVSPDEGLRETGATGLAPCGGHRHLPPPVEQHVYRNPALRIGGNLVIPVRVTKP